MGLITKEVEVKWNKMNKKWYESKGYIFTRYSDKFMIKTSDLTKSNHIKIDIECDCCSKEIKNIEWRNYKKHMKKDGSYYCYNCAMKLYGTIK